MWSTKKLLAKLNEKTVKRGNCWLYTGSKRNGYGRTSFGKKGQIKTYTIHRLSAHIFLGLDLDSKELVLHKNECRDKSCWNPDHLYIGTPSDNHQDAIKLGFRINANLVR